MDLDTLLQFEWSLMAPEFTILIVATVLSLLDLFLRKEVNRNHFAWLAMGGIALSFVFLLSQLGHESSMILFDTYRFDPFSISFKFVLLAGTFLVLLLSHSYKEAGEGGYRGEFYYLILIALLGGMMMASSADLITLFVGLEMLAIPSYILAGIQKRSTRSNESAMKYIINGGISTAITLFGFSYIYGLTGSTQLNVIAQNLSNITQSSAEGLAIMAFLITFVGLAFKISTVPFYMWTPDVYEGSPTPVTAFLSVVSKAAGFIIILRVFMSIFGGIAGIRLNETFLESMIIFIGVLASLTMIIGNTIALRQRNMKRLLAYSSIAHAGYLLVPFVALSPMAFESMWFYMIAYMFMTLGAFAVLQVLIRQSESEDLSIFSGLFHRSPGLAILMTIFLLSLAGIPGTAGFIGKLNIFLGALFTEPGNFTLVAIMLIATVISYIYYFGIFIQMFFRHAEFQTRIRLPKSISAVLVICAAGTIILGVLPGTLLDFYHQHIDFNELTGSLWK
ncbi:NADH-quinone oxidoreductase subunit NuoN [Pontibacillus marinus]|uniref:NADH-quinone oxidoreductase subunit N n=1 Tax=Pontibacillus marinus BH030004 = DSM 16465 TaxID=1385511 RepID=A0A0A5G5G3_9BACI|nr:NADH-quinone oxidoreductase subunit NuoN [Pontibacillus marinus]KGX87299.1 NADH:ubiquinone oxidoreductase subunit N [Pontibacillus marinus BH030004 = DSM 16465]